MEAKRIFLFLSAMLPALFAYPQTMPGDPAPSSPEAQAPAFRPLAGSTASISPETKNGVTYACGGVGIEEEQKMKSVAQDYDLLLTFAARDAGYLADVDVRITDENGNPVLKTFCGAPMLLVTFPHAGRYDIHAETGGYTLDRKVSIKKRPDTTASVTMLWPQQIAEAVTPAGSSSGDSGAAGASGSGGDEDTKEGWDPALNGGE
jgi:hypothetical protein